jgi:hypothetical protein
VSAGRYPATADLSELGPLDRTGQAVTSHRRDFGIPERGHDQVLACLWGLDDRLAAATGYVCAGVCRIRVPAGSGGS